MFRRGVTFLLFVYFTLGSTLFQQIHVSEVNRELASIPVPRIALREPLTRMPVRPPVHDPSSCLVCIMLHMPATAHGVVMPIVDPIARVGWVAAEPRELVQSIAVSCDRCRGPPVV